MDVQRNIGRASHFNIGGGGIRHGIGVGNGGAGAMDDDDLGEAALLSCE